MNLQKKVFFYHQKQIVKVILKVYCVSKIKNKE